MHDDDHHSPARITASLDPELKAVLTEVRPLTGLSLVPLEEDIPGYVRAASAIRRHGAQRVIVQDDVNALVLLSATLEAEAILLPRGAGGLRTFDEARGNKHQKMDLEACVALPDGRLVAFGSGSTTAREQIVVLDLDIGTLRLWQGAGLYRALRSCTAFAGSELNVEGAVVLGDALRLFQRGNGAIRDTQAPVNATVDLALTEFLQWIDGRSERPPILENVVQFDLGSIHGTPFTFTDAARLSDGRVAFLACAEASPDTVQDGEVLGCRFGVIDGSGARVTEILELDGSRSRLKLEGIEPCVDLPHTFDVLADMDRPHEPSLLGRLEIGSGL